VDQLVVMVCLRGEGWARVGGDGGRPLAVAAGDLLVLPPHRPHVYGADAARPWSIYWIHVAGKKAGLLHRLLSDEDAAPVSAVGAPPAVYALFEEILDTLRHSYGREHLLIAALATGHLLGQLLALHRRRPAAASARERIDQTIQFVRARLGARISVPELARLANLSCSHFAATFKRQTGYAVLEYFMRLRMQKAAHLLDTTALPVKAVAATVGYDDPLYFSRLFRRIYDLSPARYRQIKKG
jgi:AraC-like DNA-binding protein